MVSLSSLKGNTTLGYTGEFTGFSFIKELYLFRGAMGFSVFGIGILFFSFYQMATGQLTKKETSD